MHNRVSRARKQGPIKLRRKSKIGLGQGNTEVLEQLFLDNLKIEAQPGGNNRGSF